MRKRSSGKFYTYDTKFTKDKTEQFNLDIG